MQIEMSVFYIRQKIYYFQPLSYRQKQSRQYMKESFLVYFFFCICTISIEKKRKQTNCFPKSSNIYWYKSINYNKRIRKIVFGLIFSLSLHYEYRKDN